MAVSKHPELERQIASILLLIWDPIGVSDEPKAQDEYDGYVSGVFQLIEQGQPENAIADHLLAIERDRMGLPGDIARARAAARKLAVLSQ